MDVFDASAGGAMDTATSTTTMSVSLTTSTPSVASFALSLTSLAIATPALASATSPPPASARRAPATTTNSSSNNAGAPLPPHSRHASLVASAAAFDTAAGPVGSVTPRMPPRSPRVPHSPRAPLSPSSPTARAHQLPHHRRGRLGSTLGDSTDFTSSSSLLAISSSARLLASGSQQDPTDPLSATINLATAQPADLPTLEDYRQRRLQYESDLHVLNTRLQVLERTVRRAEHRLANLSSSFKSTMEETATRSEEASSGGGNSTSAAEYNSNSTLSSPRSVRAGGGDLLSPRSSSSESVADLLASSTTSRTRPLSHHSHASKLHRTYPALTKGFDKLLSSNLLSSHYGMIESTKLRLLRVFFTYSLARYWRRWARLKASVRHVQQHAIRLVRVLASSSAGSSSLTASREDHGIDFPHSDSHREEQQDDLRCEVRWWLHDLREMEEHLVRRWQPSAFARARSGDYFSSALADVVESDHPSSYATEINRGVRSLVLPSASASSFGNQGLLSPTRAASTTWSFGSDSSAHVSNVGDDFSQQSSSSYPTSSTSSVLSMPFLLASLYDAMHHFYSLLDALLAAQGRSQRVVQSFFKRSDELDSALIAERRAIELLEHDELARLEQSVAALEADVELKQADIVARLHKEGEEARRGEQRLRQLVCRVAPP